jgi:hypothetical protein
MTSPQLQVGQPMMQQYQGAPLQYNQSPRILRDLSHSKETGHKKSILEQRTRKADRSRKLNKKKIAFKKKAKSTKSKIKVTRKEKSHSKAKKSHNFHRKLNLHLKMRKQSKFSNRGGKNSPVRKLMAHILMSDGAYEAISANKITAGATSIKIPDSPPVVVTNQTPYYSYL